MKKTVPLPFEPLSFEMLFQSLNEPILICDSNLRILRVNHAFSMVFKGNGGPVVGKLCHELFAGERDEDFAKRFEAVFRTRTTQSWDISLPSSNGEARKSFEFIVSPISHCKGGQVAGAIGHARDISRRRDLEKELKASRGRFTNIKEMEAGLLLAKTSPDRIITSITDELMVVDPTTYRIVQANDHFLAGTIYQDAGELSGGTCYEMLFGRSSPCHEDGIFCPVRRTYETGQPLLSDVVHSEPTLCGGVMQVSTHPVIDGEGKVDLVIRIERDVTEKKNLEQALALRSEELLRTRRRLEDLFELSREVGTKATLSELVRFLLDFTVRLFPGSEPAFLLLDSSCEQFMRLGDCGTGYVENLQRIMDELKSRGLGAELLHQTRRCNVRDFVCPPDKSQLFALPKIVACSDTAWSTIPLFVRGQCIGLLLLVANTCNPRPTEDLRFLEALCQQASGHLRNLVMHEARVKNLKSQPAEHPGHGEIIGRSKRMQEIYELIDLVSSSDVTVLITGENGTGKELVANAIHKQSHRRKGPFVVANCSAYSPTLLESEIFGHEKGAFTGASHQKKGRVERAHGGTLFLDEIGEVAPSVQIFLLRFLQDHCFERVGGEKVIAVDVRVLAATNRDLHHEVQAGRFRDDLFYRLNVLGIHLPGLRERKEDIPLLAHHFLAKHNTKEHKSIQSFSSGAMQVLLDHDWPGNVRQLENAVSHAVVLSQGELIRRKHLPKFLWETGSDGTLTSLSEGERMLILKALQKSNWNKHDAARRLKISRSTLYSKMRRYGLVQESGVRTQDAYASHRP